MKLGASYSPISGEVLRNIADRRHRGESLRTIAAALTAAEVPTATGLREWTPTSVRSALLSRRGRAAMVGAPCDPPTAPPSPPSRLGASLQSARVAAKMSTRSVAVAAGLSATTVERLENGRSAASAANVAAVLVALRIPPADAAAFIEDGGLRVAVLRVMVAADLDERELLAMVGE
jgi:DNA-binding XRE family transcriptional regulator